MKRQVLDWKDMYQTLSCANILRYVFGQNIILHLYIRIVKNVDSIIWEVISIPVPDLKISFLTRLKS